MQTAVVVVQVAGVQALINRFQVRDGEREVPECKSVLLYVHLPLTKQGPVVPFLSGGIEVHKSAGFVRTHPGGLEVPVSHLLLVLLETLSPKRPPVHTRQHHRAAQQDHNHGLLAIPKPLFLPSWKIKSA